MRMRHVKRLLIVLTVLLLAIIVAIPSYWDRSIAANVFPSEQITVDGTARHYRIVIPHATKRPSPIVFAFHGIGDSTESMATYSRLDQLASRGGFILVYPAARKSMWSTIDVDPEDLDANPDIRFFDQLLAFLSDRHELAGDRVYVVGMSNGATFAEMLAIARSHDVAAVVAHSGTKPRALRSSGDSRPIMLIVGVNDLAFSAMHSYADQSRSSGRVVQWVPVPGLAHEWSVAHNTAIWDFLSQHRSNPKPQEEIKD